MRKKMVLKESLADLILYELLRLSDGLTNRSFCPSNIFRVQLKAKWIVGEWPSASDQLAVWRCRLVLFKRHRTFSQCLVCKFIYSKRILYYRALSSYTWYWEYCSECHLNMANDHFVVRLFRGFNWNPTEQLVKGLQSLINRQFEKAD